MFAGSKENLREAVLHMFQASVVTGAFLFAMLSGESNSSKTSVEQQPQPTKPQSTETQPTQHEPKSEAAQAADNAVAAFASAQAGFPDTGAVIRLVPLQVPVKTQDQGTQTDTTTNTNNPTAPEEMGEDSSCVTISAKIPNAFRVIEELKQKQGIQGSVNYDEVVFTVDGQGQVPYKAFEVGAANPEPEYVEIGQKLCTKLD